MAAGESALASVWSTLLGDSDGTETLIPRVPAATAPQTTVPIAPPPNAIRASPDGGKAIDLSYDKAQHLQIMNGNEESCTSLHLCRNKLRTISIDLRRFTQLRVLDLSFNELSGLPESIGSLSQLTELDVRSNQLLTLPKSLSQCVKLARLYLHQNRLSELPDIFEPLRRLQILDLSSNRLEKTCNSLWLSSSIKILNVDYNRLTEIPTTVGNLKSLVRLSLSHNLLRRLPTDLSRLSTLEELDLSFNQLERLPSDAIGKMTKLRELTLQGNAIAELPVDIADLSSLEILDIRQTIVQMLPLDFAKLRSLDELRVNLQGPKAVIRPPPHVCRRGAQAAIAFLETSKQVPLTEGAFTASGDGLQRVAVASPQLSFVVTATDASKKTMAIVPGSLSVLIDVIQATDEADDEMAPSIPVKVATREEKTGAIHVTYDATIAGHYIIRVMSAPKQHIQGSPFHVNVAPGPLHPLSCLIINKTASASDALSGLTLTAGKEETLRLIRCDRFGNRIPPVAAAQDVTLKLLEAYPRPIDPAKALKLSFTNATPSGRSKKVIEVVVICGCESGRYRVAILVGNESIRASPVDIVVVPGLTSPAHSTVTLMGTRLIIANVPTTFVIQARDSYGNARTAGGDIFDAIVTSTTSNSTEFTVKIVDNNNGEYIGTYMIPLQGLHLLHIRFQKKDGTLAHLPSSPFQIKVTDTINSIQDQYEIENIRLAADLAVVYTRLQQLQQQLQQQQQVRDESAQATSDGSVVSLRKVFEPAPSLPDANRPPPPSRRKDSVSEMLISSTPSSPGLYVSAADQDAFVSFLLRRSDRLPVPPWPAELLIQILAGLRSQSESDRADKLVLAVIEQIRALVRSETLDVRELAFWLANTMHLIPKLPANHVSTDIGRVLVSEQYTTICKVLQNRLSPKIVKSFFDENDSSPSSTMSSTSSSSSLGSDGLSTPVSHPPLTRTASTSAMNSQTLEPVMSLIHAALTHLEIHAVPNAVIHQLLSQWLFFIDAVLLNSLLIRKKASAGFFSAFSYTLSQWENWIAQRRSGILLTTVPSQEKTKTLIRTSQAVRLLQTSRLGSRDVNDLARTITHLSPNQVLKLLTLLDGDKISAAQQAAIVEAVRAARSASDSQLRRSDSSTPEIEASASASLATSSSASLTSQDGLFIDTFYLLPFTFPTDWQVDQVQLPSRLLPSFVKTL